MKENKCFVFKEGTGRGGRGERRGGGRGGGERRAEAKTAIVINRMNGGS